MLKQNLFSLLKDKTIVKFWAQFCLKNMRKNCQNLAFYSKNKKYKIWTNLKAQKKFHWIISWKKSSTKGSNVDWMCVIRLFKSFSLLLKKDQTIFIEFEPEMLGNRKGIKFLRKRRTDCIFIFLRLQWRFYCPFLSSQSLIHLHTKKWEIIGYQWNKREINRIGENKGKNSFL